jgi:hypothetical protein
MVEVEDCVSAEITSPATDQITFALLDRDEDRDDPEHEQRQQRPEQDAVPRGKVAASCVADRTDDGYERAGGSGGLPERCWIGLRVRGQDGTKRPPQQQPEAEEKSGCELVASAR